MSNVLIYDSRSGSKLYNIRRVFTDLAFPGTGLTADYVTEDDFTSRLNAGTDLLVLPGARAGTPYRAQLAGKRLDHLQRRLEEGLQVLGICAGAYVLSRQFTFHTYDGYHAGPLGTKQITDNPLGLVPVEAFGPDARLYTKQPRDPENPWTVYTAAHLERVYGQNGHPRHLFAALSEGPSFRGHDPAMVTPLAGYVETGDTAVLQFRYGQGGGILSGPVLEVGGDNLIHYVHPRHREDPHCLGIISKLEASRMAWGNLWSDMLVRLLPRQHHHHARMIRNMAAPG